jgi:hypothetical protein
MSNETNDPWCKALHECTACLREQRAEDADTCLAYLNVLEQRLTMELSSTNETEESANKVPANYPYSWKSFCSLVAQTKDFDAAMSQGLEANTKAIKNVPSHFRFPGKRLLTRIYTAQSELFASKATNAARTSQNWTLAAALYETAIGKIHTALDVTDTAISNWWKSWEMGIAMDANERELLARDASIVVVALESLTDKRSRLLSMGKREEGRLVRRLQPQWESRDVVKQRMGTERWKKNPSPKHDFSRLRADLESELRDLRAALETLEEMDPEQALLKASGLHEQLQIGEKIIAPLQPQLPTQQQSDQLHKQHRYNDQRPSPEWMAKRVSLEDYPDPVAFGWTFTGSWESVEFFERMVVSSHPSDQENNTNNKSKLIKLDWYFTTATVKTSLDHPVQGKTQLFAKECSPKLYTQVLTNPRTHTGKRYQRKPRSPRTKQQK